MSTDVLGFVRITVLLTFKLTHHSVFYIVFGIQQLQFVSCLVNH